MSEPKCLCNIDVGRDGEAIGFSVDIICPVHPLAGGLEPLARAAVQEAMNNTFASASESGRGWEPMDRDGWGAIYRALKLVQDDALERAARLVSDGKPIIGIHTV